MTNPGIRVAAVGTGYFSRYHYDAWARIPPVRLEAVCGHSNRERAHEVARQYGVPRVYMDPARMLDEVRPDLLDVITPPESHLEIVRLAAQRRIPVICQKPLAPTFAEAQELVGAAEAGGVLLVVHENWRFKPWFREIARLLEAGVLGDPYSVSYRMRPGDGRGPRAYLDRQPYFQKMKRFLIHETGIHMVDVFRFLMGEVVAVCAALRRLNEAIAGEDAGLVMFEFAGGSTGLFDGNRLSDFPAANPRLTLGEMLVEGSEGRLRLDGEGRLWRKPHGEPEAEHRFQWVDRGYGGDSVHTLQAHVVEHLLRGRGVENQGREYLRNLHVEEAIYRAHAERRWVMLSES